jgi:hypothetical protein
VCTGTCVSKKGRKQNATDLGVEEWRIPVGRAETTREGEGEEEVVAGDDHGNNTRKRERGKRNGRGGTRVGGKRKNRARCMSIDVGTGGVRGSDERGDRRAEERQKRV